MGSKQAESYKNKGNEFFKKGDYAQAIENYTYAIESHPNNHAYYSNRATCYAKMEKWDKCLRDAERSIKLSVDWVKGWYRKGQALGKLGRHKEAYEAFVKACALQPDNADFRAARDAEEKLWKKDFTPAMMKKDEGNQKFAAGAIEEALAIYEQALALCGESETKTKAALHNNMAHCYMQLYKPKKQIDHCTACLDIEPNNVKALLRRAAAFESIEKPRQALTDFERACYLDPSASLAQQGASRVRNSLRAAGKSID